MGRAPLSNHAIQATCSLYANITIRNSRTAYNTVDSLCSIVTGFPPARNLITLSQAPQARSVVDEGDQLSYILDSSQY